MKNTHYNCVCKRIHRLGKSSAGGRGGADRRASTYGSGSGDRRASSMFGDEGRTTPVTEKGSRETALSNVSGAHTHILYSYKSVVCIMHMHFGAIRAVRFFVRCFRLELRGAGSRRRLATAAEPDSVRESADREESSA